MISKPLAESEPVGLVLGSMEATPLEFWVGIEEGRQVQLDDLIVVETTPPRGGPTVAGGLGVAGPIRFYGVVDVVRKNTREPPG